MTPWSLARGKHNAALNDYIVAALTWRSELLLHLPHHVSNWDGDKCSALCVACIIRPATQLPARSCQVCSTHRVGPFHHELCIEQQCQDESGRKSLQAVTKTSTEVAICALISYSLRCRLLHDSAPAYCSFDHRLCDEGALIHVDSSRRTGGPWLAFESSSGKRRTRLYKHDAYSFAKSW